MIKNNPTKDNKGIKQEKANKILEDAIYSGSSSKVRQAILIGADVTIYNNRMVKIAAGAGLLGILKILEEAGADIHASDDDSLRLSAMNGKIEVFKYLHERGADLSASNYASLSNAIIKGHIDIVKYIHQTGVDLKVNDNEALKVCVRNNNDEVLTYLLENGCSGKDLPEEFRSKEILNNLALREAEIQFKRELKEFNGKKTAIKRHKIKKIKGHKVN